MQEVTSVTSGKPDVPGPTVEWSRRPEARAFGDRLDFLSPEKQHLNTGRLAILPPSNPEKRNGRTS